jgi:hypothetical protein
MRLFRGRTVLRGFGCARPRLLTLLHLLLLSRMLLLNLLGLLSVALLHLLFLRVVEVFLGSLLVFFFLLLLQLLVFLAVPWRGRSRRDALQSCLVGRSAGRASVAGRAAFPARVSLPLRAALPGGAVYAPPACLAGTTPLLKSPGLAVAAMGGLP